MMIEMHGQGVRCIELGNLSSAGGSDSKTNWSLYLEQGHDNALLIVLIHCDPLDRSSLNGRVHVIMNGVDRDLASADLQIVR